MLNISICSGKSELDDNDLDKTAFIFINLMDNELDKGYRH